ncbi:MAG: hypothetical protein V4614_14895 [Pseudomonadota bacterium]
MKLWPAFYDLLLPDVPGCPPAMASLQLRHAAREFCERTKAWDEVRGPVVTIADTIEYTFLVNAAEEEVVKLLGGTLDGNELTVRSINDMPGNWQTYPGVRAGILTQDLTKFYLVPARAADMDIKTRIVLKPAVASTGVPDALFNQYAEVIAMGAKARLMLSPKKPYTDATMAGANRVMFDERVATIARAVEKSFSRTPRRVVGHFF